MSQHKSYLGDGVYADFDGWAIVLTTENGVATTNTIVLEPEIWTMLKQYVNYLETSTRHKPGDLG